MNGDNNTIRMNTMSRLVQGQLPVSVAIQLPSNAANRLRMRSRNSIYVLHSLPYANISLEVVNLT